METDLQNEPPPTIPPQINDDQKSEEEEEDDDDDLPTLSPFALAALQEYLSSQSLSDEQTQQQGNNNEEEDDDNGVNAMPLLKEDWRLSQFWYSPATATTVANEVSSLLQNFNNDASSPSVACISCPTLFIYLKKMYPTMSAQLLEYDERFEQYGSDFTFYDYNLPEDLPQAMKHTYQIVVADPPYLSEECLKKVAKTILFLVQPGKNFLLLLTGEVQRERAAEFLGLRPCVFRPEHSSKLGNEFLLYTNYNPGERLGGWELEV